MKTTTLTVLTALAAILNVYGDITLGTEPQVVVENYQNTSASSSLIIGRNSTFWDVQWAAGFTTGQEQSVLDSALFLYNGAFSGPSATFQFALHYDDSGLPGAVATVLEGPSQPVNGISWYTAPGTQVLESNSTYWLVASAPQTYNSSYEWRATSSTAELSNLAGWSIVDHGALRTNEGSWTSSSNIGHTAVQVEAIPEPRTAAFIFLFSALLVIRRNVSASSKYGFRKLHMHLNRLFDRFYMNPSNHPGFTERW